MPITALYDFLASAPTCYETTTLAEVLDMFAQGQCDQLVVLNQEQYPVGLLNLPKLLPYLTSSAAQQSLARQRTLAELGKSMIKPLGKIPAAVSVDQLSSYLNHPNATDNGCNWALIELDGKFLGMLNTPKLLKHLTSATASSTKPYQSDAQLNYLTRLLERLPWPLMLQTANGQVVAQNPAWWEQFAIASNPEEIRAEVEALLAADGDSQQIGNHFLPYSDQEMPNLHQNWQVRNGMSIPQGTKSVFARALKTAKRCQSGTEPGTCNCVIPGQNGQERIWQFVKIPLQLPFVNSQLDNRHWLLLATDVTKEQQLVAELAAKNADLIQLTRLKDEFLACISHELKSPLTAILGLSSLLQEQAMGQLNQRQARYVRLIYQSGRHLMSVVNDILDLTRMETGQLELTPQPVQIRSVCDRAIVQAKSLLAEKPTAMAGEPALGHQTEHCFSLVIEPGVDSLVADELRLRQMLFHLLANAFKFTEPGGEVGLRVSRWEGWIAFTVWDTGIGIPEHQQHLIFQKFQQLENPLTRRFDGTGLGLVLTRALARMHGGDVSFLSSEGKGSQFTVLLPPSPPPKGLGSQTLIKNLVLVVEAVPRYIENLTEQLAKLGYQFVIARSGTEALEKARRLQPAVIFLNPMLPLLSGWDVLTLLKSDELTCQIPVIVTATLADQELAFLHKADDFLSLPFQPQTLQQLLSRFSATVPGFGGEQTQNSRSNLPLTILRLATTHKSFLPELANASGASTSTPNYRVLEADDLEQAELLARIWRPDIVLLDEGIPDPVTYFQQYCQHTTLSRLPLVTLDATTTQAASQIAELSVFPCLTPPQDRSLDTLLPVLELATRIGCKPWLLVVDSTNVAVASDESTALNSQWCQILLNYLKTSGFRGVLSRSWAEVVQQVRQQSVDLLLICLGNSTLCENGTIALKALAQQHPLPPVLVIRQNPPAKSTEIEPGETLLTAIAREILPQSISMAELSTKINQTLFTNNLAVSVCS